MSRGLIDQAEARLWLNNAAALSRKTKQPSKQGRSYHHYPTGIGATVKLNLSIFSISQF